MSLVNQESRQRDAAAVLSGDPRAKLEAYRPDLSSALGEHDAPRFRYLQVFEHLLRRPKRRFAEATSLPAPLREALDDLGVTVARAVRVENDGEGTTKLVLGLRDETHIESVVLRHRDRVTICVSTQVGCALGCRFCATGEMGFVRDLETAEIVDQVRTADALVTAEGRRVDNVVYMGMGEPLLNLWATVTSLRILSDSDGRNMARRSLSVSTVGIPDGIRTLAREEPQVNLALSLHAPHDALRNRLVPVNRRHPIAEVMDAAREHARATGRKLMVEYVLLEGTNDAPSHARAVADLIEGIPVSVNLLPCNPGPGETRGPSADAVRDFASVLEKRGIETTVRRGRGVAIGAGCGQLAARTGRSGGAFYASESGS